ncbi:sensor histidine kinase [Sulfurimonas sp.]|uniref:sensor histidine kinase n=1 Tax=Sulfurimonas sp. TaxID=2022749 RepID=UPI0035631CF7
MNLKQLSIAYECLDSIGNSLEFNSMVFEILCTFSHKTNALGSYYYSNNADNEPILKLGVNSDFRFNRENVKDQSYIIEDYKEFRIIILPLRYGYLEFVYKESDESVEEYAVMFGGFQNKINIAIASCSGVERLEMLNEDLEASIESSVNKLKHHEKMLIAQSKQATMGEMIEMIAHQWRQPITAIGMISNSIMFDLVLDELDKEDLKTQLEEVNKQIDFLSNTIDDFRNFFKEGKVKERLSLNSLINRVINLVQKQYDNARIKIIQENINQDIYIDVLKNELMQAMLNIFNNSYDAFIEMLDSEINKTLNIGWNINNERIEVYIKDNAGGIKEEIISSIFEPYFSTKNERNGTGLGLYISKIIITEHLGGDIRVQNIDAGSMFTIVLPLNETDDVKD